MNIDKNTLVKVINRFSGSVGYEVEDLGVYRNFYPGETKEISYEELEKLTYVPGGMTILKEYLEIADKNVAAKLFNLEPEPEYFYSQEDIKKVMETGTLDQFLDCLDFAPVSVHELIKDMAVNLPLNDVKKRQAIKDKFGFDVDRAIEIKNTKYDGGDSEVQTENQATVRRVKTPTTTATASGRRYKPITKDE